MDERTTNEPVIDPEEILEGLEIIPLKTAIELLEIAMVRTPTEVVDKEDEKEEGAVDQKRSEMSILPQSEAPESPRTYDA